ncbi:MAG: LpxL/LpxP family Kdo(2)-lipid IV(A) lauroyl/palmitoleoyl acyltransferase [Gammaproteobacteria bacterium]|nr:LpxL/LpxP family Kdo(2)-lipid IV(A) lauroyl/palmitoleoyl acyltransferase [Gammaproteobacteria bacterium]MCW8987440.1 LpxL/LpxP family Kdo(2)-lipid IV(A) lauroyl/palmitoleoyl acyltransferase [Gammaproteobacteria bacterium]
MKKNKFNIKPFLGPKHWPTWIALGFLRLCTLMPYRMQMGLGRFFGYLSYVLLPRRKHIVKTNIRLAFPELNHAERKKLVIKTFASTGMGIFETAMAWWGSERRLKSMVTIKGLEHLQNALAQGKGVILLSAHFSSLELSGRLLSFTQPFQVTYKRAHNPLMEAVLKYSRKKHFLDAINTYDTREMITGLKKNVATWYAMDQDLGARLHVFAPFMGIPACTLVTTSRLAKMSGALVVPYFPKRLDDCCKYELTIHPVLENFPSGDDLKDTTRINDLITEAVKNAPDQYLWVHRRFKTRPPGEPDVYTKL